MVLVNKLLLPAWLTPLSPRRSLWQSASWRVEVPVAAGSGSYTLFLLFLVFHRNLRGTGFHLLSPVVDSWKLTCAVGGLNFP